MVLHTYKFTSKSNPDAPPYTATQFDDGEVICSCKGYKYNNRCWHVKAIADGTAAPQPGECAETEDGDTSFNAEELDA